MTDLEAIRKRDAEWGYEGKPIQSAFLLLADRRALLAHIDAITEAVRPEHGSPYHRSMVPDCEVCALLRGTPQR